MGRKKKFWIVGRMEVEMGGKKKEAKLALLNIWCSRQRFVSKIDSKHLQESTML
jgi:hypothetical protein